MAYFSKFGNVWITLKDGSKVIINDITAFATISDSWRKDARLQLSHSIRDGELPHAISNNLYDTVDYWWTILLVNNIYDFDNQWPRSYEQLNKYIDAKYPGQLRTAVHHYINPQGLVADLLSLRISLGLTSDAAVINQANLEAVSIEEFEIGLNENKRNIILIDPDYISTVQSQFDDLMQPEV